MAPLREEFVSWQCRIRKEDVRIRCGRPSQGVRPLAVHDDGTEILEITVLLIERNPETSTQVFRHIVRQTADPSQRRERALKLLAAEYYQDPKRFGGDLAATFGGNSAVAIELVRAGHCVLQFAQGARTYHIPCTIRELDSTDPVFQATTWHNHLFNPHPPTAARVLAFTPLWSETTSGSTC